MHSLFYDVTILPGSTNAASALPPAAIGGSAVVAKCGSKVAPVGADHTDSTDDAEVEDPPNAVDDEDVGLAALAVAQPTEAEAGTRAPAVSAIPSPARAAVTPISSAAAAAAAAAAEMPFKPLQLASTAGAGSRAAATSKPRNQRSSSTRSKGGKRGGKALARTPAFTAGSNSSRPPPSHHAGASRAGAGSAVSRAPASALGSTNNERKGGIRSRSNVGSSAAFTSGPAVPAVSAFPPSTSIATSAASDASAVPAVRVGVAAAAYSHAAHAGLRFEVKLRRQLDVAVQVITDELEHLYAQHDAAIKAGDAELAAMFKEEATRIHGLSKAKYTWLVSQCNSLT